MESKPGLLRRRWRQILALALVAVIALGAKAWHDTMADPVVHETKVVLAGLAPDAPPIRVVLISDIHVAGPDMPPARLERIVRQINALKPDVVAIAGDLVSAKSTATHVYTPAQIIAPLGRLEARYGVFVVPGNHDHWFDLPGLARELRRHRITLLANQAARAGPLTIGGLDDAYTSFADMAMTTRAMAELGGPSLILTHSPDLFPDMPSGTQLMLAGHTHCGQIRLPIIGALTTLSRHGDRYGCGRIDEAGRTVIVGAGLGTSLIPVRFGTRPEIWLIELRGR